MLNTFPVSCLFPAIVFTRIIQMILGLDPAQPGFNMSDPSDSLGPEDADFVGMFASICLFILVIFKAF